MEFLLDKSIVVNMGVSEKSNNDAESVNPTEMSLICICSFVTIRKKKKKKNRACIPV